MESIIVVFTGVVGYALSMKNEVIGLYDKRKNESSWEKRCAFMALIGAADNNHKMFLFINLRGMPMKRDNMYFVW